MPDKPFVLSPKAIVLDSDGRCLLVRRSMRSKYDPGKWDFPGGKMDAGEGFAQALLREAGEEVGLGIALVRPAGAVLMELPHLNVVCLLMEARVTSGEVRLSREHEEFRWVDLAELPRMDLCGHFRRFAAEYVAAGRRARV